MLWLECLGLEALASSQRGAIDGSGTQWDESHTLRAVQDDQGDRTPLLSGKTELGLFSLEKALGRSYCGLLVLK